MVQASQNVCLQKNSNSFTIITLHKTQFQMYQGLQQKLDTLNLINKKIGDSLELIGMGEEFLGKKHH